MEPFDTLPLSDRFKQLKSMVQYADGKITINAPAAQNNSKLMLIITTILGVLGTSVYLKWYILISPLILFSIIVLYVIRMRHIITLDCKNDIVTVKVASKDTSFKEYKFSDLAVRANKDNLIIDLINLNELEMICSIPFKQGHRIVFEQMIELLNATLCRNSQTTSDIANVDTNVVKAVKTAGGIFLALLYLGGMFCVFAFVGSIIVYLTNTGVWGGVAMFVTIIELLSLHTVYSAIKSVSWPTQTGHIGSVGIREDSDSDSHSTYYMPEIEYEYEIDGKKHKNKIITLTLTRGTQAAAQKIVENYTPGNDVTVYYHPKKHSQSVLIPGIKRGDFAFPIIAGVIATALWVISLVMSPGIEPERFKKDYANIIDQYIPLKVTIDNREKTTGYDTKKLEIVRFINSWVQDSIINVYGSLHDDNAEMKATFQISRTGIVWVDSLWTLNCDQDLENELTIALRRIQIDTLLIPKSVSVSLYWKF